MQCNVIFLLVLFVLFLENMIVHGVKVKIGGSLDPKLEKYGSSIHPSGN